MSSLNLAEVKAAKVVDARGTSCPGPLLDTKIAITTVPVGAIVETMSSDEGSKADIPLWAKATGQEFLGAVSEAGYDRIFVRRLK
jgi:tRNA 2-thiouridine synthesizing protein A